MAFCMQAEREREREKEKEKDIERERDRERERESASEQASNGSAYGNPGIYSGGWRKTAPCRIHNMRPFGATIRALNPKPHVVSHILHLLPKKHQRT